MVEYMRNITKEKYTKENYSKEKNTKGKHCFQFYCRKRQTYRKMRAQSFRPKAIRYGG